MQIRIENPNGSKAIEDYHTSHPVKIDTGFGVVVVGVFNDDIQVVRVTGDKESTIIKFNDKGLL